MLGRVSQQLLTLLQLTRMALVFTAISNALAALLLRSRVDPAFPSGPDLWTAAGGAALVAVGMYGFGMALNDVIDRRRDVLLARSRPLPSGRISVPAAVLVAAGLLATSFAGGWLLTLRLDDGLVGLAMLGVIAMLVTSYDFAGKYLVWVGLLLLGLIRFGHALVPAPQVPVAWHPLWLLNHVALVSAVAYAWENKRPTLTRGHAVCFAAGLVLINVLLVGALFVRRGPPFADALAFSPALVGPVMAAVAFAVIGHVIRRRAGDRRAAGRTLMLFGLLWLIVYDALFVAGYVGIRQGTMLLLLVPVAYLAVRGMRLWSGLADAVRKPQYLRSS